MSYVPAWKRLGLELKRPQPQDVAHTSPTKKRKTANNESNGSRESRKTPPNSNLITTTKTTKTAEQAGLSENLSAINASKSPPKSSSTKAKKVSFSADTKNPPDRDVLPPPVDDYYYTEPAIKERKAIKRQKRELRHQLPGERVVSTQQPEQTPPSTPTFVPSYLNYLDDFSKGTNWKFNKTLQTKLLDNIFSIPSDYNNVISDYIKGLKGQGARERLRADSQQIVSESKSIESPDQPELGVSTDSGMDSSEDRKRAGAEAMARDQNMVKHSVEQSEERREELTKEWQLKADKRRKAELILLALAAQDDEQSRSNNVAQPREKVELHTSQQNKPRSRGRKRRNQTGVPDDDDISSDSSSSDSSSDESSEESSNESAGDEGSEENSDSD